MEYYVDILLCVGKSLCTGDAVCTGVVNGLCSTVDLWDPLSGMSFIDSSDRLCPLSLCLSSVDGRLGELFRDFDDGSWRLPSPSWNIEPFPVPSWGKFWCGLAVLYWGSGRLRCDSYRFVPVYDGRIFHGSPTVWVFPRGKEGSVEEIEVVPDEIELGGGADKDVVGTAGRGENWDTPRTVAGSSFGDRGLSWACCLQAKLNEVSGQFCGSSEVSYWMGGIAGR